MRLNTSRRVFRRVSDNEEDLLVYLIFALRLSYEGLSSRRSSIDHGRKLRGQIRNSSRVDTKRNVKKISKLNVQRVAPRLFDLHGGRRLTTAENHGDKSEIALVFI